MYAAGISFMSSLLFVPAGTFPTVLESSMSLLKQPAGAVESPDKWRAKSFLDGDERQENRNSDTSREQDRREQEG